jgi:hypothetical protein
MAYGRASTAEGGARAALRAALDHPEGMVAIAPKGRSSAAEGRTRSHEVRLRGFKRTAFGGASDAFGSALSSSILLY